MVKLRLLTNNPLIYLYGFIQSDMM